MEEGRYSITVFLAILVALICSQGKSEWGVDSVVKNFGNASEWELHDFMVDYLESNTCIDAFAVLETAIETKAKDMMNVCEDKFSESHGMMGEVVDWLLKYKLPEDCDRNSKLFKNIAIWCVNSGFSLSLIIKIDRKITDNCPGRKRGEIKGWIGWVKRGKRKEVNIIEIGDVVTHARG